MIKQRKGKKYKNNNNKKIASFLTDDPLDKNYMLALQSKNIGKNFVQKHGGEKRNDGEVLID